MSYMTTPERAQHSWESSPTLTPGSVSSPSCTTFDPDEGDLEERKGFSSPFKQSPSHRHISLGFKALAYSLFAALLLWINIRPALPQQACQATAPIRLLPLSSSLPPASPINTTSPSDPAPSTNLTPPALQQDDQRYDHYMEEISLFFKNVRLDNPDGLGFAQMGFRTRLYAEMLRKEQEHNSTQFTERERDMWFFLPGISKFRERSQSRQENGRPTRGIILSADTSRFIYTCHFLAQLRIYHKSNMPVEIFYLGDSDLPQSMREHLMQQYDVTTVDLSEDGLFDESFAKIGGYAIKPYALLATSFSEVMMVDADTVLLSSPETFFDQKGYKENGTVFFQDRHVNHKSKEGHNFVKQQMGHREVSYRLSQTPFWTEDLKHLQESGVVVADRSRPGVFAALLFAAWQNGKLMRDTVLDRYFWGDKESFWMAFELADIPYYMVNHSCGAIGREHVEGSDPIKGFCTEHPLHFFDAQHDGEGLPDPNDNNRTLGKPAWFNGSIRNNKYHKAEVMLLDPTDDTIFVMNGTWTYYDETRGWCLTDYKRFGIHEYNLGVTLGKLGRASREGEKLTMAVIG
jgi:hypothetical protein